MSTHPQTVSELFPSPWLHHDDLNGRTFVVTIRRVEFDNFLEKPGQHNGKKILKAILDFGRSKKLILNKTQCEEIADITGSEAFKDWPGRRITLAPGLSHNNKPTIKITPPPAPKASDKETSQAEEDFLNA